MAPTFIFLRHGEAEHNVAFHEIGNTAFLDSKFENAKLTQKGIEQSIEVAKKLSEYTILDIWSSPLQRCIQTTLEVFEEVSASTIYLHDNLLERLGNGHACNVRAARKEIEKEHGFLYTKFLSDLPPYWSNHESSTSVHHRMVSLILLLAHLYEGVSEDKYILIVSSSDAIACLTGKSLKNGEYAILSLKDILHPPKIEVN